MSGLLRFLFLILAVFICFTPKSQGQSDDPEVQDAIRLRAPFQKYLQRHNTADAPDTTDAAYSIQWGPAMYAPYTVHTGHLLNKNQLHAVVFCADGLGTSLQVYLWKKKGWSLIFASDSLPSGSKTTPPLFQDWNHDGIKDILVCTYDGPSAPDWCYAALMITDKSGEKMHVVDGFDEIRYPKLDPRTGHITTFLVSNYAYVHKDFAFDGLRLGTCTEFAILVNPEAKVRDSAYSAEWRTNDKLKKRVYASPEKIDSYAPTGLMDEISKWSH